MRDQAIVITAFGGAQVSVHRDSVIGAAFVTAAGRHPTRPAVVTTEEDVSYATLATVAGGVAAALGPADSVPGSGPSEPPPRVGLLLDHGADMVAAILGAAIAGWCYVPLDPTYPQARLQAMVDRVAPAVVVAHHTHLPTAQALAAGAGHPPAVYPMAELSPAEPRPAPVAPDAPVYVLFTSGSTGTPKGVTHTHRSVLHGIANHVAHLGIGVDDRLSLLTPFSYDMSVSDLYGAVLTGAAVVPCDLRQVGVPRVAEALRRHRVTLYHSTPTVFRYVLDYLAGEDTAPGGDAAPVGEPAGNHAAGRDTRALPDVRTVLLGGEPATRDDLAAARRHCAPECHFVNGYGASEASFTVQLHLPAHAPPPECPGEVLPIGTPLPGYEVELLDQAGCPLPESAAGPGELAIRSPYLSTGYWGDPAATAAVFTDGGVRYCTGDVVRRAGGVLHYEGRADRQVKVNGQRIELGEIEAVLATLPAVARAAAAARTTAAGGVRVDAYVQPAQGHAPTPAPLRAALAARLPAPLVPRTVQVLAQLPLTISGKVDVAALPLPDAAAAGTEQAAGAGHAERAGQAGGAGQAAGAVAPGGDGQADRPHGVTEELVAGIWCAVLGIDRVSRRVSFFDAGGCSDALTRLQYQLTRLTGVDVPLVRLLAAPTVAAMARQLDTASGPAADTPPDAADAGDAVDAVDAVHAAAERVDADDRLAAVAERAARRRARRQEVSSDR